MATTTTEASTSPGAPSPGASASPAVPSDGAPAGAVGNGAKPPAKAGDTPVKGKSSPLRIVIPVVLLAAAGYWGFTKWSYGRGHESTDNAQIDGQIVPVVAKVGGYVTKVNVIENAHVAEGASLVQIDEREFAIKLEQAEAELAAARAAVGGGNVEGQAAAQVRTATSQREVGSAQVVAARANLTKAQSDLTRAKELAGKQIISLAQLDAAQATFDAAEATLTATERQVNAASSGVVNAQAGVLLARARLQGAQATRDNARLQESFTNIEAPLAGSVSRKNVEVGQLIQAGQTLMSIVADTGVFITANFKETQLDRIHVGQKVDLDVDAYGSGAEGEIQSISSATGARYALLPPDNATGNFTKVVQRVPVRIRVTKGLGPEKPLRPGMSVVASVIVK